MSDESNLNLLVQKAVSSMGDGRYKSLFNILKIIAKATNNKRAVEKLELIKMNLPISFDAFEKYYYMSPGMDPRRSINFKDIGRVRFDIIPSLYEKYVMDPLNDLTMEMVGQLSKDKGSVITNFIADKAKMMEEVTVKEPEIILEE